MKTAAETRSRHSSLTTLAMLAAISLPAISGCERSGATAEREPAPASTQPEVEQAAKQPEVNLPSAEEKSSTGEIQKLIARAKEDRPSVLRVEIEKEYEYRLESAKRSIRDQIIKDGTLKDCWITSASNELEFAVMEKLKKYMESENLITSVKASFDGKVKWLYVSEPDNSRL